MKQMKLDPFQMVLRSEYSTETELVVLVVEAAFEDHSEISTIAESSSM